ncbi:MAG: NAD(P)/FAD-dependent oxidoreductase [Candidatus Eremiobacteraeota bacterium]|nr:NAD(P)/FAD-dependent oxidoreductase [Candidatus Eremiobacteraeota bacterium]
MDSVAIVGGGPAGSACALQLARAGIDVTVFERSQFPRVKVCGEYLNSGAIAALETLSLADRVRPHAWPLRGIRLRSRDDEVELRFSAPAWSIARSELDSLLLDSAREAGARVVTAQVEDVRLHSDHISVQFRDSSGVEQMLSAAWIVGADGIGSLVARKTGLSASARGAARFALGGHYRGFGALNGFIEMYVHRQTYFAINPLDSQIANVMVVVNAADLERWRGAVDEHLSEAAAELGAGRRSFAGVERIGKRVAVGPLDHRTRALYRPRVLLIGDAAGFVDPFTGQGVMLALQSAVAGANAILQSNPRRYAFSHGRRIAGRRALGAVVKLLTRAPSAGVPLAPSLMKWITK